MKQDKTLIGWLVHHLIGHKFNVPYQAIVTVNSQCLKITKNVAFFKFVKMDHFGHFWLAFVHSKCKRSSLRSQCWIRLFSVIFKHCAIPFTDHLLSQKGKSLKDDSCTLLLLARRGKKVKSVKWKYLSWTNLNISSPSFFVAHDLSLLFSSLGIIFH